jgi:hypothetical protein
MPLNAELLANAYVAAVRAEVPAEELPDSGELERSARILAEVFLEHLVVHGLVQVNVTVLGQSGPMQGTGSGKLT